MPSCVLKGGQGVDLRAGMMWATFGAFKRRTIHAGMIIVYVIFGLWSDWQRLRGRRWERRLSHDMLICVLKADRVWI